MELLLTVLTAAVGAPEDAAVECADWSPVRAAARACGELEEDVALAIELEDSDAVRAILGEWYSGKRHLLEHDRGVLKRALKAFRKRLKVTVLDAESTVGGGPMSSGRKSDIVAIRPPERYPTPVWEELVRQGRLVAGRMGMYELPPE